MLYKTNRQFLNDLQKMTILSIITYEAITTCKQENFKIKFYTLAQEMNLGL